MAGLARSRPLAGDPRVPLLAGALAVCAAAAVGAALAYDLTAGVALLVALGYAPLVALNLPLAIALWVPLVFLQYLTGVSRAWQAAMVLLILGILGSPAARSALREFLARNALLAGLIGLLLAWVLVSIGWASQPDLAGEYVPLWLLAAGIFAVVRAGVWTPSHARLLVATFVAGALVSVLAGFLGAPTYSMNELANVASTEGQRLSGGAGDPNVLAAGLIPAIVLAAALGATVRSVPARSALVLAIGVMAVGLAATQSRGALVAAAVAVLASLVLFKHHRVQVVALVAVIVAIGAVWFAGTPGAWERITSIDSSGTGRADLWRVAWRMSGDYPVLGVGLGNFIAHSSEYTREPGELTGVRLIVDQARVAHNVYLQTLAEMGVVGLALFLAVMLAALAAAISAARRFERLGDVATATLCRGLAVALIALLAASTFLSNGFDKRLWILLGLASGVLGLSLRAGQRGST